MEVSVLLRLHWSIHEYMICSEYSANYRPLQIFVFERDDRLCKYRSELEPSYRHAILESTTIETSSLCWYWVSSVGRRKGFRSKDKATCNVVRPFSLLNKSYRDLSSQTKRIVAWFILRSAKSWWFCLHYFLPKKVRLSHGDWLIKDLKKDLDSYSTTIMHLSDRSTSQKL